MNDEFFDRILRIAALPHGDVAVSRTVTSLAIDRRDLHVQTMHARVNRLHLTGMAANAAKVDRSLETVVVDIVAR